MYITETTDNVKKLFEQLVKLNDFGRLKFTIYIFDSINNGHINSKNEVNPNLIEDEEMLIFNLDMVGLFNNYAEVYLEKLIGVFNNEVEQEMCKGYLENGNTIGIEYDNDDKLLLSMFTKLSFKEKTQTIAEIFIRLDNESFFKNSYPMLELNIDGYETARNIIDLKI